MGGSDFLPGRVLLTLAAFFAILCAAPAVESPVKLKIIATLFPQYDFARQIAGDRAEVRLLLPPGAESHSYEPTPSDMKDIARADLFVYTGPYMEPWAKRLADTAAIGGAVIVVDASRGVPLHKGDADADHEEEAADHDHDAEHDHDHDAGHSHEFDPHIWLDPIRAAAMADTIAAALAERDPGGADLYRKNAAALRSELEEMDSGFRKTVAESPRRQLVFGERFAFAYFLDRYGLEEIGAYKSCAPGAEPGLKAVLEVIHFVRDNKVRYIYREATTTSRISKVINKETGAEILAVDSLHNLPADKLDAGYTYQRVMRDNMAAFAKGLQ